MGIIKVADGSTRELCDFLADLRYESIPEEVIHATKLLLIDWLGSTLAGARTGPALALQNFARQMGPVRGKCTDFSGGHDTSAFFASMINGASSHVVEQDDLHNASVLHPATVVFSATVAAAQDRGASGREFLTAAVGGYEAGIRIGEFMGRSHYVHFHTTGTVGTLAAAAAVSRLLGLDTNRIGHAFGTAGTKAAGLWEFLVDGADSKQIHTASAASSGLFAAYASELDITGAKRIFDGTHGLGNAMSSDADPERLNHLLGERWATSETSYKLHASCRHTHPCADALLQLMDETGLEAEDIHHVTAHVHQGAIDVLGPVTRPTNVHQSKFCMGSVLGLIAVHKKAGLEEFDKYALHDLKVQDFCERVEMVLDREIDEAYPARWIGKVTIKTRDGSQHHGRITAPKGDPSNPLSEKQIVDKAHKLALYGGRETIQDVENWISQIWSLEDISDLSEAFMRLGQSNAKCTHI